MPESNVEIMRRAAQVFNARDVDAFVEYCDPHIEFESVFAGVGGVFHGHDGLRRWFGELAEIWGEFHHEPEAFFDLGERTVLHTVLHARGGQSGAEVTMPIAAVFEWHDRLIVRWKGYAERGDALRDLGVSADELEPIAP